MLDSQTLLAVRVGLFIVAGLLAATGLVQIAKGGRRVAKMSEANLGRSLVVAGGAIPAGVVAMLASGAVFWLATNESIALANALPH